jgi:hypothetical protein
VPLDTVILKDEVELFQHLLRFLNNRNSPLKLCYRASLHGWSSQDFHKLCNDKAGTVVLVKVGNWIFGGYTDQTWQGKNYYFTNVIPLIKFYSLCSFHIRALRILFLTYNRIITENTRMHGHRIYMWFLLYNWGGLYEGRIPLSTDIVFFSTVVKMLEK